MVQKFKGKKKNIYIYISIFVKLEHPSHSDASFVPNLFLKGYKKYDSIFNFVTPFGFTSTKI